VRRIAIVALALLLCVLRADAAFHLIRIVEVFPGTAAAPDAQYIVLQAFAAGQTQLQTHTVTVYDRFGAVRHTSLFGNPLANGAEQMRILIATPAAESLFNITADLSMTPMIAAMGGKICFEDLDCMTWGNYAGPAPVGTPFASPAGLRIGKAVQRNLGGNGTLEESDDHDDSAQDFLEGLPVPRNNANQNGTLPPSVCGNNLLESLEECDDGNTLGGDGCSALCLRGVIFEDGFETVDLSRWAASSATDFGDLFASPESALASSATGVEGFVDDVNSLFVQDDSPLDESRYRARFHLDPNGFDPGEGSGRFRVRVLLALDQMPSTRRLIAIVLRRLNGQYSLRARVSRDDGTRANTAFFNITDAPHAVEFDWRRASGPSADGEFRLWIDDTLMQTLTGIDNDAGGIDAVRMGALSVKPGAQGTIYWDELRSAREPALAPEPGQLVINEVDYDQPGADTGEFVEIYNRSGVAVSLDGLRLILITGGSSDTYLSFPLSGVVPPNGYAVVASPSLAGIDPAARIMRFAAMQDNIQNGSPDGLALFDLGRCRVLDALSYEGSITSAFVPLPCLNPIDLVEGTATPVIDSDTAAASLGRSPNGSDTDDAATDWVLETTPTPGGANLGGGEVPTAGVGHRAPDRSPIARRVRRGLDRR
jgi:cysteine-rich repeat protein